jgi:hypothetical protein
METFPIVKRKDEEKYGSFRRKVAILEAYDSYADTRLVPSQQDTQNA